MNERINSLAEQADEFADNEIRMPGEYHPDWHNVRDQKFAELIVRECIEVIDNTSDNTKLMRVDPYQKIIWAIEEHFGVES